MSYHFNIKKNRNVTCRSILNNLPVRNVQIAYFEESDLDQELVGYVRFYIPGLSTRGITVGLEDTGFDVGINILSSKEDYILGCELAKSIAAINQSGITPEDGDTEMSIEEFDLKYNDSWAEGYKIHGLSVIGHMIRQEGGTMTVFGCLRDYYIGPYMLEELSRGEPDEEEFYNRVMASIKKVQFIDENDIRVPSKFEVTEDDGGKWGFIVLSPGHKQLLIQTDVIFLAVGKEERHRVPYEALKAFAESNFARLDECQFVFPALPEDAFMELMEQFGFERKKDWWKFWN